ncbi:MAG: type II toxin-antitoxin system Phd/YefM family antitoxin [Burkholderiales bacterium]
MQINIAAAKSRLSSLVERALAGEEVVIARANKPLVRLAPVESAARVPRQPGSGRGELRRLAPDFDAPLDDFRGYR